MQNRENFKFLFSNIMNLITSRFLECGRQARQMEWKRV